MSSSKGTLVDGAERAFVKPTGTSDAAAPLSLRRCDRTKLRRSKTAIRSTTNGLTPSAETACAQQHGCGLLRASTSGELSGHQEWLSACHVTRFAG